MATTLEKIGARVYLVGLPFAAKDEAKRVLGMSGSNFDRDRKCWWVGAAKRAEAEAFVATLNNGGGESGDTPKAEDLSNARVYAKVKYQDRTFFVIAETRDVTRCRLVTLADDAVPFWVDCAACELVKRYEGREERGFRGPTGRMVYQTLGSMRKFVNDQKAKEAAGVPQCAACGKRSGGLIEDYEDGLMKCRGCADIPSE